MGRLSGTSIEMLKVVLLSGFKSVSDYNQCIVKFFHRLFELPSLTLA